MRETFGLSLYRHLTSVSGPLLDVLLRRRLVQGKEDAERLPERRGITASPRPGGALVWMHCASVGESLSVLPLIDTLTRERPDLHFLVTSGTLTSARLMGERLPANAIHQFIPLDHPDYCARFLDHWQPDFGLIIESELWPNLILGARARNIPLVLANARLSEKSFHSWQRARRSIGFLLTRFELILAQDLHSAERFRALGAVDVSVPGNLKYDANPLPVDDGALATLREQTGERPLWLAASTHEGEEAVAGRIHARLKAIWPDLLTLIVPRHPARGDAIAKALRTSGLSVAQRSQDEVPDAATDIYLADTLGEIGLFYRLAPIAFIGGSLTETGGHNPLEAVRLETALLFGPHMFNFAEPAADLLNAGAAIQVENEDALGAALERWLADADAVADVATQGKIVGETMTGVTTRVCDMLIPLLPPAKSARNA
jgi:3-deoxy-D-manno-octulosonic-acid transferase